MNNIVEQAIQILEQCGYQDELIDKIRSRDNSEDQGRISEQIVRINSQSAGGIKDYCDRARRLLEESRQGLNPFDNYKPQVPSGVFLKPGEIEFDEFEQIGLQELAKTGFVLIAGGLGERLGYNGIKIDLPVCTIQKDYCYLKYYAQYALACRERALKYIPEFQRDDFYIPFAIMVSDDTKARTVDLLEKNNYFGLGKHRVDVVKQENVPALMDNNARIAINEEEFKVITKPHGHGDIHNVLFDSGVAKKWRTMGKEWMVFIQDTNALALKAIPSVLGVSRKNNWQMNSICVPRMPGESMGAICRLVDERDPSRELVINVEYGQRMSSLRKQGCHWSTHVPEADKPDRTSGRHDGSASSRQTIPSRALLTAGYR